MGELRSHKTLIDKEKRFSCYKVRNAREFDQWYGNEADNYRDKENIFRGVHEAKYELYTSSQRLWWAKDYVRYPEDGLDKRQSYCNFLSLLMKNARDWNGNLLERYYSNLGIYLNDFALLSLMQHYNLPTPLLDFTSNLEIALFFAFYKMTHAPKHEEIDNYVSLYIINLESNKNRLLTPEAILKDDQADESDKQIDFKKVYDTKRVIVFSEIADTTYSKFKFKLHSNTNFNIINQKGLFLFNGHPWKPLTVTTSARGFEYHPFLSEIICIDLHKSLKEYILKKYLKDVNEDFLFPSFNKFEASVLISTLEDFKL